MGGIQNEGDRLIWYQLKGWIVATLSSVMTTAKVIAIAFKDLSWEKSIGMTFQEILVLFEG